MNAEKMLLILWFSTLLPGGKAGFTPAVKLSLFAVKLVLLWLLVP